MDKIVAFDFDGTLAPSFPLIVDCFIKTLDEYGVKMDKNDLAEYYGPTEKGMLAKILGKDKGSEAFIEYCKLYKKEHSSLLPSFSEELLAILGKIKSMAHTHLAIVTGRSRPTAEISLKEFGIFGLFEKIYCGSYYGVNKPTSIRKCLKYFSLGKEDMIYIGDSIKDISSCAAAGIQIISANYYHTADYEKIRQRNPDKVARTYRELDNLLSVWLTGGK